MKKIRVYILLLCLALLIPWPGFAEEVKPKYFEGIEFLGGFGWGKLRAKDNYNLYPVAVGFDFSLKPLIEKLNVNFAPLLQFEIEPYLAYVSSPNTGAEGGVSLFFKIGLLPQDRKLQPYIKFGAGPSYMSLHTREQGTQFNFVDSGCVGIHYFFQENTAFTLEGRYRHLSNAGIDEPNSGINTAFILAGASYRF